MLCQNCKKRTATVHLTEIVNNDKREIHLCEKCAKDKGVAIKTKIQEVDFPDFFGQLAETTSSDHPEKNIGAGKELVCSNCGLTFEAFRNTGKFGCPNDYIAFKEGLIGLLNRIHGSTQHRGKVPNRATDRIARQKELMEVREELKRAIDDEAYEKAAELRDLIHSLKHQLGQVNEETAHD